jgi:methionyl-tRNA synthetase
VDDQHFYLTTTLPYVNAEPHIGFALEIVAADVICRYQKEILGKQVVFNTGTDEHGQKIYQEALKTKKNTQNYVDEYAAKFESLKKLLNLSYTHFIRTTNPDHKKAAQHFWQLCDQGGYIYKKNYTIKYCVGCELEKTESELVDGRCPLHPNQELEIREEENYFFKFSAFQKPLLEFYQKHPQFVKPESKMKEIVAFVKGGLQDFSISRLKTKMPWGVAVPGDDAHVMYVWFDALINYISTLGWPNDETNFHAFWPGVQLAGKDNLRQQSAMWQAMLMAAKLLPSHQILINGFISVDGQKMSKSLGNVIAPAAMVERYGADATRYLLMNLGPFGTDVDVSWEKLDTTYTADLANGLGNLCSRVAKLAEQLKFENTVTQPEVSAEYHSALGDFDVLGALSQAQAVITELNQYLTKKEPWKLDAQAAIGVLTESIEKILLIGKLLSPFMPDTAGLIINHFSRPTIKALEPLFPRLKD